MKLFSCAIESGWVEVGEMTIFMSGAPTTPPTPPLPFRRCNIYIGKSVAHTYKALHDDDVGVVIGLSSVSGWTAR